MLLIYAINRNDRAVNNKQSVSSSFQPAKRRLDARRWATCFQFNVGHPIRQLVIVYFHHVQSWTSPPTPLPPLHLRFPQILDLGRVIKGPFMTLTWGILHAVVKAKTDVGDRPMTTPLKKNEKTASANKRVWDEWLVAEVMNSLARPAAWLLGFIIA